MKKNVLSEWVNENSELSLASCLGDVNHDLELYNLWDFTKLVVVILESKVWIKDILEGHV